MIGEHCQNPLPLNLMIAQYCSWFSAEFHGFPHDLPYDFPSRWGSMSFSQVVLIVFAVSSTFVGTAGLSIIANGVAYALGEVRNACGNPEALEALDGEVHGASRLRDADLRSPIRFIKIHQDPT